MSNRKDSKGYVLRTGETQRNNGTYCYSYRGTDRKRHYIYARTLAELRLKEQDLKRDYDAGLDPIKASKVTINDAIDRYLRDKRDIKDTTLNNYIYTYEHFIKGRIGKMRLSEVRYSDIKGFYQKLILDEGISPSVVENIHTILHPAFNLTVRDHLIRDNPTEGVMAEIKKSKLWNTGKRQALTIPQQRLFMNYLRSNKDYMGWVPVITILLGTGMRIGECLGLRWEDVDFEKRIISVNHNLVTLRPNSKKEGVERNNWKQIQTPKTKAGIREIPMIEDVFQAFIEEYEIQKCLGFCKEEIGEYKNFIFSNSENSVLTANEVNRAIHRLVKAFNKEETARAKKEGREPELMVDFSCHVLRHTFCTRFCENETNLKVIQDIMGHADITTTMQIYAEATKEKKQEIMANLEGKIIL